MNDSQLKIMVRYDVAPMLSGMDGSDVTKL